MKPVDKADAGTDEDAAHDQCAEHTPEEHAVLQSLGNAEIGKDQEKNKKIVNAEREFENISGNELERDLRTLPEMQNQGEDQSQDDVKRRPDESGPKTDRAAGTVKDGEIQHQHAQRENVEENPEVEQLSSPRC